MEAMGTDLSSTSVKLLADYESVAQQGRLDPVVVVVASPCWPEQLEALRVLEAQNRLRLLVLLDRRKAPIWNLFGKKTSATAEYLNDLGFHLLGSLVWDGDPKSASRLSSLLKHDSPRMGLRTVEAGPEFIEIICPEEESESTPPEIDHFKTLDSNSGRSKKTPVETTSGQTVFQSFFAKFSSQVSRQSSLTFSLEDGRNSEDHLRRLACFRNLDLPQEHPERYLFIESRALPYLYSSLREWCLDWQSGQSATRPLLIVHGSGLPAGPRRDFGGITDANLLLSIPGLSLAGPSDEEEADLLLQELKDRENSGALLFTNAPAVGLRTKSDIAPGRGRRLREGTDVSLLAWGSTVYPCLLAAESLRTLGLSVAVYDLRYRRPVDRELVTEAMRFPLCVSVEEQAATSSFSGSLWPQQRDGPKCRTLALTCPDEIDFEEVGNREGIGFELFNLHAEGISRTITSSLGLFPGLSFTAEESPK